MYSKNDPGFRRKKPFVKKEEKPLRDDILAGKNAVHEALESGREIDKILFASGSVGSVGHLVALARKKGIVAQECDRRKLDSFYPDSHQGIIAFCSAAEYKSVDDMLALAESRGEKPLLIVCDGITDPHNLGAVIRSAEVSGAHGVVIPKRRSAGLNSACAKAAAGALEYLPVAKCSSTLECVKDLKARGLSVYAAAGGEEPVMYDLDLTGPCAIVIGSEGDGISYPVRKECDSTVSIPQKGKISSLNASNAAAVLLYEVSRQRNRG